MTQQGEDDTMLERERERERGERGNTRPGTILHSWRVTVTICAKHFILFFPVVSFFVQSHLLTYFTIYVDTTMETKYKEIPTQLTTLHL